MIAFEAGAGISGLALGLLVIYPDVTAVLFIQNTITPCASASWAFRLSVSHRRAPLGYGFVYPTLGRGDECRRKLRLQGGRTMATLGP